jgi:hypothetical protein
LPYLDWFLKTGTMRRAMLSGLVLGIALGTNSTCGVDPDFRGAIRDPLVEATNKTAMPFRMVYGIFRRPWASCVWSAFLIRVISLPDRQGSSSDPATGRHLLLSR